MLREFWITLQIISKDLLRVKENASGTQNTVSAQIQPQSWIQPHPIQNVIQPQSKIDFETYNPSSNTTPFLPILAFFKSNGNNEIGTL